MKNIPNPANKLDVLLKAAKNYFTETAKHNAGVVCYDDPQRTQGVTLDPYDGILADTTTTKTSLIKACLDWETFLAEFKQMIQSTKLTRQERTALLLTYIGDKRIEEIESEIGYQDAGNLLICAEKKLAKNSTGTNPIATVTNKAVQDFLDALLPRISLDAISWDLLHEMYQNWAKKNPGVNCPYIIHKKLFIREVKKIIDSTPAHQWNYTVGRKKKRITQKMRFYIEELLLDEYNCVSHMRNPQNDRTHLKERSGTFYGLYRKI